MIKWMSIAALFGCGTSKTEQIQSAVSGPFEIQWAVHKTNSGAWINNGGSPFAKVSTSYFSIRYRNQVITAGSGENTAGKFWQALFLKDAVRPAVLFGTHSMFLATEDNGQVSVQALHEQNNDFATYQWLDSDDGKPGPEERVYLGDDSQSSRYLEGGRYLMVNAAVVVDVQTLETFPFVLNSWEVVQSLDGYNAGNSPVKAFSPGKTQMVFACSRSNPEDYIKFQYALVVMDFKKNTAYAVPFDRTDLRFESVWDATPEWIDSFFEWKKDAGGNEKLQLRKLEQAPYWQGRFRLESYGDFAGRPVEYNLFPILPDMYDTLVAFISQEYDTKEIKSEKIMDSTAASITIGDVVFKIFYQPEEKKLGLYLDQDKINEKSLALLKKTGDRFNEELAKGRFQEAFGEY